MQRFPGLVASRGTRHRPRRPLKPSIELLETRELMSQSPFSLLFQAPPAKNPPVVPRSVSSELPKNVSGRIQGLYELSLTKHPLYQGTVFGHVIKAPMFNPGYTGPKRLDLDVIGTNARISPQQELQLTGEVLGPIDPAQPAIYSFLIDQWRGKCPRFHPVDARRSPTTWRSRSRTVRADRRCRLIAQFATASHVDRHTAREQCASEGPYGPGDGTVELDALHGFARDRPGDHAQLLLYVRGRGARRSAQRHRRLRTRVRSPGGPGGVHEPLTPRAGLLDTADLAPRDRPGWLWPPGERPATRRSASPGPEETAKLASSRAGRGQAKPWRGNDGRR